MLCRTHARGRHRHRHSLPSHSRTVQQLAAAPIDAGILPRPQHGPDHRQGERALQYLRHELRPRSPRKNLRPRRRVAKDTGFGAGTDGRQEQQDRQSVAVALVAPQDILRLRPENPGHDSRRCGRPHEVQHDLQHRRYLRLRLQKPQTGVRRQGRRHREEYRGRQCIHDHRIVADTGKHGPVRLQEQTAVRQAHSHGPGVAAELRIKISQHQRRRTDH